MNKTYFRAIPAAYVLVVRNRQILLLRRMNTGYADGLLALPAGHIDGNELASVAAAREAFEEVGININPTDLRCVHVAHRLNRNEVNQERIDFFFRADKWDGDPYNKETDKSSEIVWVSVDDLPDDTAPYIKAVISKAFDNVYFSEYIIDPVS